MTESPKPLGMSDFFALEAGEYLERLDGMLAQGDSPSADEIVRLARALRGSALMANQPAIARAAAGLEVLARAVREGRRAWDPQTQQLALRAVDDLKIFVRRAGSWTDADTAKAEALAVELEQVAGRPSAQIRAVEALGLDAGARAFVAREGAAIAGALERAAQALRANPRAHDPLPHVMRALQPLRGLAALTDLPPLPDLLEGIERAIGELSRSGLEPPANVSDLFQIAGVLVKFMESEPDVVSIGSLYFNDSGPHIVSRGVPAARPSTLGKLELVSHGEHLRQAADSLERAPSATQRELRAHTLGTTFRALADAGGGVLADRVAQFAMAAREALAAGIAVNNPAALAAELRRAGDLLARSGTGDEEVLATELDALTAALRTIQPGAAPGAAAGRDAGGSRRDSRPRPRPPASGRAGDTRNARPRWVVGRLPAVGGERDRRGVARGARRRCPERASGPCSQLPTPGSLAGRRRARPLVSGRARPRAGPGATGGGEAGVGRHAAGPRRRSLRPRCPRPRAQPLVGRRLPPSPPAGPGSSASRLRPPFWPGPCAAPTGARSSPVSAPSIPFSWC